MHTIVSKERDGSRYFQAFNSKLYPADSFVICIAVLTQVAKFLGIYGRYFQIMKKNVEHESFFFFPSSLAMNSQHFNSLAVDDSTQKGATFLQIIFGSKIITFWYILCSLFQGSGRLSFSKEQGSCMVLATSVYTPFWIIYQDL